ncbi:MAG TPA: hypothetical protein VL572_06540, partial [Pyrinomonadaceae bacterium]|nr:hypothetical protein [Pyrinomonadaceae bacterium]
YPVIIGAVPALGSIYATDEATVPISILVDDKGVVKDVIPGWSAETQKKLKMLIGVDGSP